jgi:hypothetical protein
VKVAGILCEQTQTIAEPLPLNDNSKHAGKDTAQKHDNQMAATSKTINIHYSQLIRNSVVNMTYKLAETLDESATGSRKF